MSRRKLGGNSDRSSKSGRFSTSMEPLEEEDEENERDTREIIRDEGQQESNGKRVSDAYAVLTPGKRVRPKLVGMPSDLDMDTSIYTDDDINDVRDIEIIDVKSMDDYEEDDDLSNTKKNFKYDYTNPEGSVRSARKSHSLPTSNKPARPRKTVSFGTDDDLAGSVNPSENDLTTEITSTDAGKKPRRRSKLNTLARKGLSRFKAMSGRVRSTRKLNANTGYTEEHELFAEVVTGLTEPMNPRERRRKEFSSKKGAEGSNFLAKSKSFLFGTSTKGRDSSLKSFDENFSKSSHTNDDDDTNSDGTKKRQYRLTSRTNRKVSDIVFTGSHAKGFSMVNYMTAYLHWSFKASLCSILLSICAAFIAFTLFFGLIIYGIGLYQPQCLLFSGLNFEDGGSHFIDAYSASWQTFSTVGYGVAAPTFGYRGCYLVNAFAALEAFVGVLFGGFASAVIFGKVTKVQSIAQVRWSRPVVLRYGSGVAQVPDHDASETDTLEHDDRTEESEDFHQKTPCPVLEFRIANELYSELGGEILNCTMTVWVSTLADAAPAAIRKAANLPQNERKLVFESARDQGTPQKGALERTFGLTTALAAGVAKGAEKTVGGFAKGAGQTVGGIAKGAGQTTVLLKNSLKSSGESVATGMKKGAGKVISPLTKVQRAAKKVVKGKKAAFRFAPRLSSGDIDGVAEGSSSEFLPASSEFMEQSQSGYDDSEGFEKSQADDEPEKPSSAEDLRASKREKEELFAKLAAEVLAEVAEDVEATKHIVVEEDPLVPSMIYSKLDIDAPDSGSSSTHPFFKRVWRAIHILDEKSPLLSPEANQAILRNNGYWPNEWNSPEAIRNHVSFNEIFVTLNGTSSVNGNAVYSQNVYTMDDIAVGWRFAGMLVQDPRTEAIGVDLSLLHTVQPQRGGGEEYYNPDEEEEEDLSVSVRSSSERRRSRLHIPHGESGSSSTDLRRSRFQASRY